MGRRPFLPVTLDREKATSLQAQLAMGLRQRIQAGALAAGSQLPSSRELARDLGVSRNTVVAAYDQLLGEGYLETRLRSGIFVSESLRDRGSLRPVALDRNKKLRAAPPERLQAPQPLRPSQPDVGLFPLALWNRLRNRVLKRHGSGLLHYQSKFVLGLAPLRQALAEYLLESRGVRCDWNQIAITGGSQHALYLLATLLLQPGDTVAVEDPGYVAARQAFLRSGAKLRAMPVDDQGLVVPSPGKSPRAADQVKLIYTTPSRHFPTGATMPVARRMALLETAARDGSWVIEDDYDSEFRYAQTPLPSLHGLDSHRRVIYVASMSKVLFPSLRIGYVVLPPELIEPFAELRATVDDHGPLIDQATLGEFVASGEFYRHIRRCRKVYASRLETFLESADEEQLPLTFPFTDGGMNQAGFFVDSTLNDLAAEQRLEQAGITAPALSRFAMRATRPGLLFGFTAFIGTTLRSTIRRIASVLRSTCE
ncbi:MAG: PLP-dependent aminotransferase family protein [Planctomycetes bacterium]|nr:PLP-dependent aminotransferase family protein [Planctomycetota bacterium]